MTSQVSLLSSDTLSCSSSDILRMLGGVWLVKVLKLFLMGVSGARYQPLT